MYQRGPEVEKLHFLPFSSIQSRSNSLHQFCCLCISPPQKKKLVFFNGRLPSKCKLKRLCAFIYVFEVHYSMSFLEHSLPLLSQRSFSFVCIFNSPLSVQIELTCSYCAAFLYVRPVTWGTASLILRLALHALPPTCPLTDPIHNLFQSKMKNQTCAGGIFIFPPPSCHLTPRFMNYFDYW